MPTRERQTFPLVPRRRLVGLPFGTIPSRRRGHGADVSGSRPYEPGDPVSTIDWFASARLSSATGRDEFVVHDRSADEAPRVALVCDRRPAMGVYRAAFPWLSKSLALVEATTAIATSAAAARCDVASIDFAGAEERDGEPYWLSPGRRDRIGLVIERQLGGAEFDAPENNVTQSLQFLGRRRSDLPSGSFVFVLSDFLVPVPAETWLDTRSYGWDVVPVVIQDPTWEQSFPNVASVLVPLLDPVDGRTSSVRMTPREVDERRAENEQRHHDLLELFGSFGFDTISISSSDPGDVDRAFVEWAEARRQTRWTR
jgi:uncharacterized protein (DUF58 family)